MELEKKVVAFYSIAYQYHTRIVLQYARSKPHRFLRDAVSIDSWKTMLEKGEAENRQINEAINVLYGSKISQRLNSLDHKIMNKAKEIIDLQKTTLANVQVSLRLFKMSPNTLTGNRMRIKPPFYRLCTALTMLFLIPLRWGKKELVCKALGVAS